MSRVFELLEQEAKRQEENIELIASENFVSDDILRAIGSCAVNKYSEGYPGRRYYGGCQHIDKLESYCQELWKTVFETDYHVNVQPHSGSQANYAAFASVLRPKDTILSMDLNHGGHLSHGSSVNFSGKLYNVVSYGVDENGWIDMDDVVRQINDWRPQLILAGASAYPRAIDFEKFYEIINAFRTDSYNPIFMVDMAHIAGLIAAECHQSPFGFADIITTTTHKTLRGPRGGMIFCKLELAKKIDSAIFPGSQGGPLQNMIAGKAVCAEEILCGESFKDYINDVVNNCKAMCDRFIELGYNVVTGGTDNHLFLLDLTSTGLSGREVQEELDKYKITVNKNCIPNETRSPMEASGIRIGTAAMTTKGFTKEDFIETADKIDTIIKNMVEESHEDH